MSTVAEAFETMEYGPAPESPALVQGWLEERGRRFGHFVAGEWRDPADGEWFDTHNPATGGALAAVAQGGPADVAAAVEAARGAQPGWWTLGPHGRARYLYALARELQRHSRFFAVLESLDNGKPIRESRDLDIPLAARHFYHHAGWAQLMPRVLPGHVPVGVAGQIIPWNFPLLMLAWKIAPALATGNTAVLKPAEFTPLTALRFASLCRDIQLPPGVVNVVTGDGRTGAHLVEHPDVDKIAFTGSTEVGRLIRVATAGSGKRLSLELGGKSPFLVFDDADLDSVVEGVVDAIWFNQGQVCCAGSRILVHEGIAERLIERLRARMETLRVGDPLDKAVDIGAIVAPVQLERIREYCRIGEEEGATRWQPSWSVPREGWFFPPTLFTDVAPAARIAQEEIFGPVVVLMTFRTPEEAVELANNTRYGLAASVWTENVNLALDVAPKIQAGTVWVNCTNLFDAAAGFGGYRESGFGREGGKEGLWEYVRPRRDGPAGAGGAPEPGGPSARASGTAGPVGEGASPPGGDPGATPAATASAGPALPPVDRTAKLYIGGRQARPDAGYSLPILAADGSVAAEVSRGNRKDIRNAVEAAHRARGWGAASAHARAQVLYFLAENLSARVDEFAARIVRLTGDTADAARREVALSVERLFHWAAWADKWDGAVHATPFRNITLAMNEPLGVVAVACPEAPPLLGFVSAAVPPFATGNSVVAVPSRRFGVVATDLYQVLETSDVPAGTLNIVTGEPAELVPILAGHDDVDALWYFQPLDGAAEVERLSASNMKRLWVDRAGGRDWDDPEQGAGEEFLRHATQVKNIWVPYGE